MPTYLITAPDGRKFRVTGEGTQEQALAHIQSQYGGEAAAAAAAAAPAPAHGLKRENPAEYDPESPEFRARYGASAGQSGARNTWEGLGRGAVNVGRQIGNVLGLKSDEELREAARLDRDLLAKKGGAVGSVLGEAAITAAMTMGMGPGVATLTRAARMGPVAQLIGSPIGRAAVEGSAQGALLAGPDARGEGALTGGAVGAGFTGLVGAGAHVLRAGAQGMKRTPEAQRLLDEGVSLTPGQMNPRGVVSHIEEAVQSVPFVGTVIRNARESAMDDWQRALIARGAAAPVARNKAETLQQALTRAEESYRPFYDAARGFPMRPAIIREGADVPLDRALNHALASPRIFADNAARAKVAGFVTNQVTALRGRITSDDLMTIRSNLRTQERRARLAGDNATMELFDAAEQQITAVLESQLPASAKKLLNAADAKYADYKVAESAMFKGGSRADGFTPTQAATAVREQSARGTYARGGGRQRDLVSDAGKVFETRQPATGARLATIAALASQPAIGLPFAGAVTGLAATQTGRRLAAGQTAAQRRAQNALARISANRNAMSAGQLGEVYLPRYLIAATADDETARP